MHTSQNKMFSLRYFIYWYKNTFETADIPQTIIVEEHFNMLFFICKQKRWIKIDSGKAENTKSWI